MSLMPKRPPVVPTYSTRRRPQQNQQPGVREAPTVAPQSRQNAPRLNNQANAIYRPGPTAGGAQAPSQTANRSGPGLPGFQTLAYQPVTRPGGISGGPTGVTMENAGDKLREWGDRGYTGAVAVPADPDDAITDIRGEDSTYADLGIEDVQGPPEDTRTQEQMYDDALRELLGQGPRDTAADEAQIQEMLRHTVGSGQADLNARLGASGFGTSGALGAMSGDMRARAAREAAGEIMGVRQGARDEWMGRVGMGLDNANTDRGLDIREDAYTRYLDAIEATLNMDNGGEDPGGDPPSAGDVIDNILDPDGNGTPQVPGFNDAPGYDGELANADFLYLDDATGQAAREASAPPDEYGRRTTWVDGDGNVWNMYETPQGWVKVRARGAATI